MTDRQVKFGILVWPQYTDWPSLRDAGAAVDRLGFESLWTWDHVYPIVGSPEGPIFEGHMTLAGWSCVTERVRLGLLVGANTFRNPALVAKMVTTLDHMCGGRAILGIGGAWFQLEHEAYGFDFGSTVGDRLDRLDEAVMIMRGMLDGRRPSGRSHYSTRAARNDPPPLQRRLPILVGGAGERRTLATVARYADKWNVGGDVETLRHKDSVLRRWCEDLGRNSDEIERTLMAGSVVVRGSESAAQQVVAEIRRTNRGWESAPALVGTPDMIVDQLSPYMDLGFHTIYFDFPAPYDRETLERLADEVRPPLQHQLSSLPAS